MNYSFADQHHAIITLFFLRIRFTTWIKVVLSREHQNIYLFLFTGEGNDGQMRRSMRMKGLSGYFCDLFIFYNGSYDTSLRYLQLGVVLADTLNDDSRGSTTSVADTGNTDLGVLLLKDIDQCDNDTSSRAIIL